MAKLSARGRKELARVSKGVTRPESVPCHSCSGTPPEGGCQSCQSTGKTASLISWERVTLAFMSDGVVLTKRDVVFREDNRRHTYNWTVYRKLRPSVTAEQFVATFEKAGYTQERRQLSLVR